MNFRRAILSALFFSALSIAACHHQADVTGVTVETVELNKQSELHDSATASILNPFKDSLDRIMNEVISISDTAMPKERDRLETLLGNFVADVVFYEACPLNRNPYLAAQNTEVICPDLVLLNTGGLRSSLPKGNITRGNIFELMPFDNEIVIVTLSGKETWNMLRYIAASGGQPVAGLQMGITSEKKPGKILIKGMPFDSTRNYRVATSDYLANGGDKMDFFKKPVSTYVPGLKIRDALLQYCIEEKKNGKKIGGRTDGRLYYETR